MKRRLQAVMASTTLLIAACSGDAAPVTNQAAGSQITTPTTAATSPAIPVDPDLVPEGEPELLAALVLFPDELPAPYDTLEFDPIESGYSPAGGSLASALDPGDEADDIIRFGQVAEFSTAYGDPDEVGVAFNAGQFATSEGAAAYLADWVEDLRAASPAAADERYTLEDYRAEAIEGAGDQAFRVGYTNRFLRNDGSETRRPGGAVVVRKGALVLWVWGNGDQTEQILDDFADIVAARVVAVADGSLPPRDYSSLGLTDPPTLALDSFAFTYEYGVEAPEGGFTVSISGVFEGPDRTSCHTTITIDGFEPVDTYLVAAGTRVWLGDITGYQELQLRDPSALSALSACPGHPNHWDLTKLHRVEVVGGEEIEISGIAARRKDLARDPAAMEAIGFSPTEIDEFTRYELAVAADGGWPVQLEVERKLTVAAAMRMYGIPTDDIVHPSASATAFERLLLIHIDDPSLEVDLPLLAG